ncbi:MAG: aldehyde dehydrogenase family protein [Thermoplasmatota archaeon]
MDEHKMYVDGAWLAASSDETTEVTDPATNVAFARVPAATVEDAKRAVAAAKRAFADPAWRKMDPSERGGLVTRIGALIRENLDAIARVETQNQGKPLRESKADVGFAASTFEYYGGLADKIEGTVIPVPGARLNYTRREPLGVTVHVAPWNFPFQLACRSIAPALAAGNTVVLKPASQTPLSVLKLAELVEKAGAPKGVFNVVTGSGSKLGPTLVGHPDVDGVILTGSVPTGQEVIREAAKNVTPITLELGGKSPNIVFADADLEKAVKGVAYGIFLNAGQMCWAGSRALVHASVHDAFVAKLAEFAKTWKMGSGLEKDTRLGPLVSRGHRESVMKYIEVGKSEGATLAAGGRMPTDATLANGNFLEPTIFTDVSPKMRIAREEIFGPVLAVTKFETDEEALALANDTDFGLYAGVWTQKLGRAHRFAADIEAGMVAVNEYPITFPQSPFGGYKSSGIGSEQGLSAMHFYTRTKSVFVNLG